jgi:circadian clock protein KaiC
VQQQTQVLVLTSYAEGHSKLLEHLRPFAFFDEEAISRLLTLVSLPPMIGMNVDTAAVTIMKTVRECEARLVLIDGFQGLTDQISDTTTLRRLLAALATQLTYFQVTMLLTITGTAREEPTTTGLTSADVVLGLHYELDGWQHRRRIEVLKQRGRAHLGGLHSYTITDQGVTITPRLESYAPQPPLPRPTGRVPFRLGELDRILGGGPTAGTITLVVGAPGVGKTTLGLAWALADVTPTATSVFLNFEEQLPEVRAKAAFLGLPLDAALDAGTFSLLHLSPVEMNPDEMAARLLDAITPTTQRVVIDNMRTVMQTLGERAHHYLAALVRHLYAAGVTTLVLVEIKPFAGLQFDVADTPLSLLSDNIIIVQQAAAQGAVRRILAVLKMRYSSYDSTLRELLIDEQGVRVLTPPQSASGVLDAAADASGLTAPTSELPTST